jgi:uncharacterized protein YcaQ
VYGYFACPVLVGEEIVAAIDLKAEREQSKLMVQQWTWVGNGGGRRERKRRIEEALHRFERFQLASEVPSPRADGSRGEVGVARGRGRRGYPPSPR